METLEEKIKILGPEEYKEAESLIDEIIRRRRSSEPRKLKLDWKGGLRHLKDRYTSVDLQHKASEWKIENKLTGIYKLGE